MEEKRVSLGIIGVGAATEHCHLPAVAACANVRVTAVADKNTARARHLARQYEIPFITDNYGKLHGRVSAVLVALPYYLHGSVSLEFLGKGVAVLIANPMALSAAEAEAVATAAQRSATLLQVGFVYRHCKGARLVKQAIREGWLGELEGFSLEYGRVSGWPAWSGFFELEDARASVWPAGSDFFDRSKSGGGVLVDLGSHFLDLLVWWLGKPGELEYRDDASGGVEAECQLSFTASTPADPVPGTVTLSRLRKLSNIVRITGSRFTMEYDLDSVDKVRLKARNGRRQRHIIHSRERM